MAILESKSELPSNETADGRFLLSKGNSSISSELVSVIRYGISRYRSLPELQLRSEKAKQALDEQDLELHLKNISRLVSGHLTDEERSEVLKIEYLKDEQNHYQDAYTTFRGAGQKAVKFVMDQINAFGNIGNHTYWLGGDSNAPYLCTTDDTCEPIIYFNRPLEPINEFGSRLATSEDLLRLMHDVVTHLQPNAEPSIAENV